MITWEQLETASPPIAELARQRFERTRVALLGTVRSDGSPRISPIEPYLSQGQLLFGTMSWSLKTRDVLRDPRCVLHSAVTERIVDGREIRSFAIRGTACSRRR